MLESGVQEKQIQSQSMDHQSPNQMGAWKPVIPAPKTPKTLPPTPPTPKKSLWMKLTPLWLALMVITPAGIGFLASAQLLKSPSLPNCPKIFWPIASASLRLYCAESAAKKQTVKDLLVAIDLVNSLSEDHPLRHEINRNIEQWSMDILNLSEEVYQAGELKEAIAMARQVPKDTSAYPMVEERIKGWQSLWNDATTVYSTSEDHLRREEMNLAFRVATRLLNLKNSYWGTTKYQELVDRIQITREESQHLGEARDLAAAGDLDSMRDALQKVQEIPPESYLYDRVTTEITKYSKELLILAEKTLDQGDWRTAVNVAQEIPQRANIENQVQDFILIARAHIPASLDTVKGLKDAIAQVQQIGKKRPFYGKAQKYIRGWQQEIAAVAALEEARKIARTGSVQDLKQAVTQLRAIPTSNPRGNEAQTQMVRWTQEIQEIEDAPVLEAADQLASFGDLDSIKQAINQASQIGRGRALYEEAQSRIAEWQDRSQRLEYQPILDQAQQLATEGNYSEAIAVAEKIKPGVVIYQEARDDIRQWQTQVQDIQNLKDAEAFASGGTAESYSTAISLASRVSSSSSWRWRADQLMNDWSQQLLAIANEQSTVDLSQAIETLQTIPYGTSVYDTAQSQIQTWEGWLSPPSVQYSSPSYDSYNDYDSYGGYDNYQEDYSQPTQDSSTSQPEDVTPPQNSPVPELNKPITSSNKFID
jgi:soluble cytochrome b562